MYYKQLLTSWVQLLLELILPLPKFSYLVDHFSVLAFGFKQLPLALLQLFSNVLNLPSSIDTLLLTYLSSLLRWETSYLTCSLGSNSFNLSSSKVLPNFRSCFYSYYLRLDSIVLDALSTWSTSLALFLLRLVYFLTMSAVSFSSYRMRSPSRPKTGLLNKIDCWKS